MGSDSGVDHIAFAVAGTQRPALISNRYKVCRSQMRCMAENRRDGGGKDIPSERSN